jgi:hypothetical protein
MSAPPESKLPIRVPELGPSLGKLVAPAEIRDAAPALGWVTVSDLRFELVTAVFELAGEAREWAATEDRDLALAALNRAAWLELWEHAVHAVAERAVAEINARLEAAGREAGMSRRRVRRLALPVGEVGALATRLTEGSGPFLDALEALEHATAPLHNPAARRSEVEAWGRALTAVARRLETAWLALEATLEAEFRGWAGEIETLRAWRRPWWPILTLAGVVFGVATYLGLVLGGYLPAPAVLLPLAQALWRRG